MGKFSDFLALSISISKTVADTAKVTIMINTKSNELSSFRLTPRSMTLDDLEWYKVKFYRNFRVIARFWKATMAK